MDSSELEKQAEELKKQGNVQFQAGHYKDAEEFYSKSIEIFATAVVYCNKAFTQHKQEKYGGAIMDATKAIEIDPNFSKAYYRRGCGHLALGHYKQAISDLKQVVRLTPNDASVRQKLKEAEKEQKRVAFEEAIAHDPDHNSPFKDLDLNTIDVPTSYLGPKLEEKISLNFVMSLSQWMREQKLLHTKFLYQILLQIKQQLDKLENFPKITLPSSPTSPSSDIPTLTVCGDVHGQYYDLLNIFEINGLPSENNWYLFNGDFVDRGSFSVEVIVLLFAWKLLYPNYFHLTRGNHEAKSMNRLYGFEGELKKKYSSVAYEMFSEVFCLLPLGYLINEKIIVLHGGLFSKDNVSIQDLQKVDRRREPPDEGHMCDALWSDPSPFLGRQPSKRGVGTAFGEDVTNNFLKFNNLDLVIRSHEVKDEGYEVTHGGKLITIFSAPNYCDQMGNKGAFIKLQAPDLKPQFKQFTAVQHPKIPPMAYTNLNYLS